MQRNREVETGEKKTKKKERGTAYCARRKRRLKRNTKFARVMCTSLLHVHIKSVYVFRVFLISKSMKRGSAEADKLAMKMSLAISRGRT